MAVANFKKSVEFKTYTKKVFMSDSQSFQDKRQKAGLPAHQMSDMVLEGSSLRLRSLLQRKRLLLPQPSRRTVSLRRAPARIFLDQFSYFLQHFAFPNFLFLVAVLVVELCTSHQRILILHDILPLTREVFLYDDLYGALFLFFKLCSYDLLISNSIMFA